MPITIRDARRGDRAGPALLYESSRVYYDAYTGSEQRSRRVLEAVWEQDGHTASWDSCRVAVRDGTVAGVCVAFPAAEGDVLARRFLAASMVRLPPWHWPAVMRHLRASASVLPAPVPGTLYVDALAVDPAHRRAGVATALLADAERTAHNRGLRGVSLDTGLENTGARALYEGFGFTVQSERRAPDARVSGAVGGPGFVSYCKPVDIFS